MTRSIRFLVILGIGLLILDGAFIALVMDRSPEENEAGPRVVSTGTALIGGSFALLTKRPARSR